MTHTLWYSPNFRRTIYIPLPDDVMLFIIIQYNYLIEKLRLHFPHGVYPSQLLLACTNVF